MPEELQEPGEHAEEGGHNPTIASRYGHDGHPGRAGDGRFAAEMLVGAIGLVIVATGFLVRAGS